MPAWLTWTFAALVSWGIWAVLGKQLGDTLTAGQSQALSTFGVVPILAVLAASRPASLRAVSSKGLVFAGVGGLVTCLGNVALYSALARGGTVSAVISLTALYPLVTILLAVMILRERLNIVQLAGVVLSFVAIWLFNVRGDRGLLSVTILYAVLPIVFWGLSGFLQKLATNHLSGEAAALVYLAAFVPFGIVLALSEPWPDGLTFQTWALVIALGFFLAFGNLAVVIAFARGGKAAVITPLGSLYPIISVPIAVVVLGEQPGMRELAGIVCALASVAALSFESPAATGARPEPITDTSP